MKAIIANFPGDVDVLEIKDVDTPTPQSDEVRIRVKAFGLNKAESYNRQGNHGSFSGKWALGIEAAGEVELDPSGKYRTGQKVVTAMGGMMFDRHGSYAELICVKHSNVIAVDSTLDFETLAALPEAYLTAWGALDKSLNLRKGDTLLVRGATSSVGLAALTYASAKGGQVIATTRQPDRVEKLRELGAQAVYIDSGQIADALRDEFPNGIDKAIELVGTTTLLDTMRSVRSWGEVTFVGFLGGPPIIEKIHVMNDLPNTVKLSFFGSGALGKEALPLDDAPISWIADQIATSKMPSIKAAVFDYEDIQNAHKLLESNLAFGKIVVRGYQPEEAAELI